ncbi:hypothetical protein SNE40_005676 [Patella caerulea]|uniref:X-linked retinitis pigmentosa GTPase regulator n=1 Tax=Patella caerulea TaxID=87958 RepID=A0AAN8JXG5_PATCE
MDGMEEIEIPVSGAIFTFGKSHLSEFLPNQFWVNNDSVVDISCGDEHTVLVAESGRVFVFGNNAQGQLGLGNDITTKKPSCIKSIKNEKIKLVACGRSHTVFASESGYLYSCGSNSESQLGLKEVRQVDKPQCINGVEPQQYKMLSCGADHSVALTVNGEVYVWGGGDDGKLGLGDEQEHNIPTLLSFDEKITCISCGYYHTAFVTESGKLYTFGETDEGKLGLENSVREVLTPHHVSSIPEKVKAVSCGGSHTAVVTVDGKVYTFGDGSNGQLGRGTSELQLWTPKCVELGFKAVDVSCGENFTAIISENGFLYTCGNGRHGRLAQEQDSYSNQFIPQRVNRFRQFFVHKVACGGCHMIVSATKHVEDSSNRRHSINSMNDIGLLNEARVRRRQLHNMSLNKTMPVLPQLSRNNSKPKMLNQTMPHPLSKKKLTKRTR